MVMAFHYTLIHAWLKGKIVVLTADIEKWSIEYFFEQNAYSYKCLINVFKYNFGDLFN